MDNNISKFNCSQCGKNLNQIIDCSKLKDKSCSFDVKGIEKSQAGLIIAAILLADIPIIIGLFYYFFSTSTKNIFDQVIPILLFVGFAFPFFILLPTIGLFMLLDKKYLIYNKSNDFCSLLRISNVNVQTKTYTNIEEISINQKHEILNYPPSISFVKNSPHSIDMKKLIKDIIKTPKKEDIEKKYSDLKESNNAEELFLGTVITMISNKEIIVRKMKKDLYLFNKKIKRFSDKIEYLLFFGEENNNIPKGELETRILKILKNPTTKFNKKNIIALDVKLLVILVFDKDESYPSKWLCDLVRKDGMNKYIFELIEKKAEVYKMKPEYEEIFEKEKNKIKDMEDNIKFYYPELLEELKKGIKKGIYAREASSD